jgi:hypothetical protein
MAEGLSSLDKPIGAILHPTCQYWHWVLTGSLSRSLSAVVYAPPVATERFPIRIGARSRVLLRILYGVRSDNAWVDVGEPPDGEVVVSFGRSNLRTRLDNVRRWRIEGPWAWITAIGIRRSIRHADVSFDGSHHGGLRLDFRMPVRWATLQVPAIYVSADDLDGLAGALTARGIPGEDARRGRA